MNTCPGQREVAFPLPSDYEDTPTPSYDSFASGTWSDASGPRTPTPMDDDATSDRGGYECRDSDELYRDRLLAEGHVIHLERGGDWSVVMGHEVASL